MPIGHVVFKIYMPCKNFHVCSQYLHKPCKAYVYCWENKYMPRLKNHMPSRARNYKSLCALGQDLHAPGMQAHLNVKPCEVTWQNPDAVWYCAKYSSSKLFCVVQSHHASILYPRVKFSGIVDAHVAKKSKELCDILPIQARRKVQSLGWELIFHMLNYQRKLEQRLDLKSGLMIQNHKNTNWDCMEMVKQKNVSYNWLYRWLNVRLQ